MMEITKFNFKQEIRNIETNLKKCSFVGFDAEFTGLLTAERFKYRLFDTNKDRYQQMKHGFSDMIITQVGLTLFEYVRDQEMYNATGYTFHLCPQELGEINQNFRFQASSLKFLCKHNFDFNKFLYDGLLYLSKEEEENVRKQLENGTLFSALYSNLDIDSEKKVQQICSDVSIWLIENKETVIYFDICDEQMRYIVHNEIRRRFPTVLTTDSLANSNKLLIFRDKNVEGAVSMSRERLDADLMDHVLGFSRVINILAQHRKPIIGHNMFLDTILLHTQFIGSLPDNYNKFKKNIHQLFPRIYDTKYISHDLSKKLSLDEVWKSNILQDLYEFFSEGKCKRLEKGKNFINLNTPFKLEQSYHEAGWDSYCSDGGGRGPSVLAFIEGGLCLAVGYCFIRLAHWTACESRGVFRRLSPSEKLAAMAPYCNKVNVIRGAIPYMSLVDDDPPSHRPGLLVIESMREKIINISKISSVLANFGSVDVQPYGGRTALIATSSQHSADKIYNKFKDNRDYKIRRFNKLQTPAGRCLALLSGALITGSLLIFLLHRKK